MSDQPYLRPIIPRLRNEYEAATPRSLADNPSPSEVTS